MEVIGVIFAIVVAVIVGVLVMNFKRDRPTATPQANLARGADVHDKRDPVTGVLDIDADLGATPIARNRMDLFWLDRGVLRVEKDLFETGKYSDIVRIDGTRGGIGSFEKSVVSRITNGSISLDDMNWALAVDAIAVKAEGAGQCGEYAKAINLYRQALRQAPGCDIFLMSMGCCYAGILSGHLKSGQWWSPQNRPMRM